MFNVLLLLSVSLFYSYHLTIAQAAVSLIPLSPSSYSYSIGHHASNVIVEFFIDLGCSACLQEWPTLQKLVENYKDRVLFMYRVFPLPYHQQAFILSKGEYNYNTVYNI